MKKRIWHHLIFSLIAVSLINSSRTFAAFAQGEAAIYLEVGEMRTVQLDLSQTKLSNDVKVYRTGGGDLGGLEIYARARVVSGSGGCTPHMNVNSVANNYMTNNPELHESIPIDTGGNWSDWIGGIVPSGVGIDHGDVIVSTAFPCSDLPVTYEVEILLKGPQTVTPTPTRTPTPVGITPTRTPRRITSTPIPPMESQVSFWADAYNLDLGGCTVIYWNVSNAQEVYWEGRSTSPAAHVEVCPAKTTTYVLEVLGRDGMRHDQSLTIYVEEPIPTPTQIPDCDPTGKLGMILIVTDSNYLRISTGDSNSWGKVKAALQQYYESGMVDCEGKPVFLDMAIPYPQGGYTSVEVKQAISSELLRWQIGIDGRSPLGAMAIIGGPDVIPMPHLPDPTGLEAWITSDDVYADLYNDQFHTPDTVITRLPDGHSTDLMLNYIAALASDVEPPEGGVVLAPLQYSSHRLNFRPNYEEDYLYDNEDLLYLDDILKDKAGSVTYLISPVWSTWDYNPSAVDQKLIRLDDLVNSMGSDAENSSVGTMLNKRDILIHNLDTGDDPTSVWYARNTAPNSTDITAYDFQEARSIPAGAHVFALLPHSADLSSGDQEAYYHIPLAMLNGGAHHYIGLTGKLLISTKNSRPYNGVQNVFTDIGIARYSGAFAQYYYRARYEDPATSFWDAKITYEREQGLSTPYDYKTYHSFIYYGLPEKGPYLGVYQSGNLAPLPQSSYNPLKGWSKCPSGDVNDCDGDGLPDKTEHALVEKFKPLLLFHPWDEVFRSGRNPPFDAYWQVSPTALNDTEGAFMTIVMTYPEDYGIDDIDIDGAEDIASCYGEATAVSCILTLGAGCTIGTSLVAIMDLAGQAGYKVGQGIVGHAGDTEAIRMFLACDGSGCADVVNWRLANIDWKRHDEIFADRDEGDPIPIDQAVRDGLEIPFDPSGGQHPVVYVSQNKHAMYPTDDACENYKYPLFGTCDGNIENCDKWFGQVLFTPPEYNVGEIGGEVQVFQLEDRVQLTFQLIDELPGYPEEYAWRGKIIPGEDGEFFCGSLDPTDTIMDEPCAGSLFNMWFDPHNNPYEQK